MAKVNPQATQKINELIDSMPDFSQQICKKLRKIIFKAVPNIVEDWKWGPNYQYPQGNMICGFGAFKNWVTLVFFNGTQIKDQHNLFNYDNDNLRIRSIKFTTADAVDEKILTAYLQEAIMINQNPFSKNNPRPKLAIPTELKKKLNQLKLLKQFEALSYTHKKEYITAINTAKQEETKQRRILKVIEVLMKNN